MKTYQCKYCGHKANSLQSLVLGHCRNSPTSKHIPYEGIIRSIYECKYCGHKANNLQSLVLGHCRNSPTSKHIAYEGSIRSIYECKHCGHKANGLQSLVLGHCRNSPTGNHSPIEDFRTENLDIEIRETKRAPIYSAKDESVNPSKKQNTNSESSKGGCVSLILLILGILGGAIAVFRTVFTSENPENKVIDRDTITQKLKEELDTINNSSYTLSLQDSNYDNMPTQISQKQEDYKIDIDSLPLIEENSLTKITNNIPLTITSTIVNESTPAKTNIKEIPKYKRRELAIELLKIGKSIDIVVDSTDLTKREVKKLKRNL